MRDLTISALDDAGQPVDTIIWLRNGGGKTALLGLFFAHLLPDAREFLRGRKENARFADHVLDGDTSYVVASWVGEPEGLGLGGALGDGRPRLVTGRVVERRSGVTGSSLPSAFFSFRPVPGVLDVDSLPWQLDGQMLSLAAFDAELHRLFRLHPAIDLATTDKQSQWAARLRDAGLDPQVFRYQRQMNSGEGEAASGFMRFRTSDEFVDFLVGVVTPAARLESLEQEVRRFSEKLRLLPDFRLELDLIERAGPLLREHAGSLRARERLERESADLVARAAALRDGLAAGVREARLQAEQARAELARLEREGERARERREDVRAQLGELDYRLATFAAEAARAAREAAAAARLDQELRTAAWRMTDPLARQRRLLASRAQLTALLEDRRADAAPLQRELEEAGAALRWRLLATADDLGRAAAGADRLAGERRARATGCEAAAERLRDEAADLRREVATAADAVRDLERLRRGLRADDRLQPQESAGDAIGRWRRTEQEAAERLRAIAPRLRALAEELDRLHADELVWAAGAESHRHEAAARRELQHRIEGRLRRLWENQAIRSLVEVERPDPWEELDTIDRLLRARLLESVEEQVTTAARSEQDRRVRAGVDARGTLPPALDADHALAVLHEAGITSAYPGWDFLRNAPDAEAAALTLLRAPELAAGILLNDAGEVDRAREALAAAGFQPTSVMAVGTAAGFDEQRGEEPRPIWPPHAGLYDPAAALAERERAGSRLEAAERRLRELGTAAEAMAAAREQLRALVTEHAAGDLDRAVEAAVALETRARELEAQLARAGERRSALADERRALEAERATLERLAARVPAVLAALADLAGREESETSWRHLVAGGPERAGALDRERRARLDERRDHVEERERLLKDAERLRGEAGRHAAAAAGLPDAVVPEHLRAASVEELTERHRALARAYEERLGADAIAARLEAVASDLAHLDPLLRGTPGRVREAAGEILASAEGQSDASRRSGLAAAEAEEKAATRAEALAERDATLREGELTEAATARSQAPRKELIVPSAERGAAMRQRLVEEAREAEREENTVNAQYGVFTPRRLQAEQRATALEGAARVVMAAAGDDLPEPDAGAAAFAGAAREADAEAEAIVAGLRRARRELDGARGRAVASAAAARRLSEQEQYRRLGPAITLRLADPGGAAEEVSELADDLDRRLPGLRADIASAESDRQMVMTGLVQATRESFRDLRNIQEASRLPPGLDAWSGLPFVQIAYDQPQGDAEWEVRLGPVLEDWVERQEIPASSGLSMLRQAVRAANRRGAGRAAEAAAGQPRSSFGVTLLKPDEVLTTQRHPVETMKFSEGQDLTTAILLYCTFVNLRVRRGGDPGGAAGALVLDNPIGKASLEKLIELQRKVAQIMKVQIIAATGVKDREAISHYPKIAGIRPVRGRDARMKYLLASDDPMGLGSLAAAEVIARPSP